MRTPSTLVTISLLCALAACDRASTPPTGLTPGEPSLARLSDPTATFLLANDEAYSLRGDGTLLEAGASRYKNGECGVSAVIRSLAGESGDATMDTGVGGKCPRKVRVRYARVSSNGATTDEGAVTSTSFLNVRKLQVAASSGVAASSIPVGGDSLRTFAFDDNGAKCGTSGTAAIAFVPVLNDGTVTGADLVSVHRDGLDTWTVSTQPDEIDPVTLATVHHDKAYCKGNGALYHMPLRFTIKSSTPLSP